MFFLTFCTYKYTDQYFQKASQEYNKNKEKNAKRYLISHLSISYLFYLKNFNWMRLMHNIESH